MSPARARHTSTPASTCLVTSCRPPPSSRRARGRGWWRRKLSGSPPAPGTTSSPAKSTQAARRPSSSPSAPPWAASADRSAGAASSLNSPTPGKPCGRRLRAGLWPSNTTRRPRRTPSRCPHRRSPARRPSPSSAPRRTWRQITWRPRPPCRRGVWEAAGAADLEAASASDGALPRTLSRSPGAPCSWTGRGRPARSPPWTSASAAQAFRLATGPILGPGDTALDAHASASGFRTATRPRERLTAHRRLSRDTRSEWSAGAAVGAWLRLDWAAPQAVDRVLLYDRPNTTDQTTSGTLTFSDGTTLEVGALPDDASRGLTVRFPARTVTWVKFTVTASNPVPRTRGCRDRRVSSKGQSMKAKRPPLFLGRGLLLVSQSASATILQSSHLTTPIFSKWRVFRVTTIMSWAMALAAILRSFVPMVFVGAVKRLKT